jgi:hypothetical protein
MTPQQQTEARRLAHCRTLEMLAASKVAGVPEGHPLRPSMVRKLTAIRAKIRAQELDHEVER